MVGAAEITQAAAAGEIPELECTKPGPVYEETGESEEERPEEWHTLAVTERAPTVDDSPAELIRRVVLYPVHKSGETFVLSGPLGSQGGGPGRHFAKIEQAERHVIRLYGRYVERIREAEKGGRWAFRVLRADTPSERAKRAEAVNWRDA